MESDDKKVVVFKIEDEEYAIEIIQIERITNSEKITRIPDCPDYLKGVINNQGRIVPVIDLKSRFNLPGTSITSSSNIIITKEDHGNIGIIVDSVSEVIDVDSKMVSPPPEIIAGILKKYIKGTIKYSGRIIIQLDLSAILDFEETNDVKEAISGGEYGDK